MFGGESPLLNKLRRNVRLTIAGFSPGKAANSSPLLAETSKDGTEPTSPSKAPPEKLNFRQAMHVASLQHRMGIVALSNMVTLNLAKEAKKRKEVLFSRKSNSSDKLDQGIIQIVYNILKSPLQSRAESDHQVVASFLETIDNIKEIRDKIPMESIVYLAQNCRLLEYKELDIIVKYGDASSSVYYVLEGEIGVTTVNHSKYTREHFSANMLSTIKPNTFFGEAGVLAKAQRTANCVALTHAKLLVMDGRAYIESVGREIKAFKQQKVGFLSRIVLFDAWDYPKIAAFHDSIGKNKIYPPYGSDIFKEREHLGSIFFVLKGQLEICVYPPPHFPKKEEIPLNLRTELMMKPKSRGAACRLLVLNEASFFGDENNPETNPGMHYLVRVISHSCELYWIKRTTLIMNVQNNPKQRDIIEQHLTTRQNLLRNQMLEVLSKKIDTNETNKRIAPGFELWAKVLFGRQPDDKMELEESELGDGLPKNPTSSSDFLHTQNDQNLSSFKEKYLRDYKSITNHEIAPVLAEAEKELTSRDALPSQTAAEKPYSGRGSITRISRDSLDKNVLMTESRDDYFFKDTYNSQPNTARTTGFKLKTLPISQLGQHSARDRFPNASSNSVESKLRSTRHIAESSAAKNDWAVSLGYIPKRTDTLISVGSVKDIKKSQVLSSSSESRQLNLLKRCKQVLIKAQKRVPSGRSEIKRNLDHSDAVISTSSPFGLDNKHRKSLKSGKEDSAVNSISRVKGDILLERAINTAGPLKKFTFKRNPSMADSFLKQVSPNVNLQFTKQPVSGLSAVVEGKGSHHRKTISLVGRTDPVPNSPKIML